MLSIPALWAFMELRLFSNLTPKIRLLKIDQSGTIDLYLNPHCQPKYPSISFISRDLKLNEQAIQTLADGLAAQTEISKATDEKLGTLIEIMLKERR